MSGIRINVEKLFDKLGERTPHEVQAAMLNYQAAELLATKLDELIQEIRDIRTLWQHRGR